MTETQKGPGGAPTRATTFPATADGRKQHPVASGVLDYFPDAIVALANVSWQGNEQHNPGQPLHWARGKSFDEADAMIRHFLQRGGKDTDGIRHTAKMAWRALALLQKELEGEQTATQVAPVTDFRAKVDELKKVYAEITKPRVAYSAPVPGCLSCTTPITCSEAGKCQRVPRGFRV